MKIEWDKLTMVGAKVLLGKLEQKSVFIRDSGENETIIRLRNFIEADVRNRSS